MNLLPANPLIWSAALLGLLVIVLVFRRKRAQGGPLEVTAAPCWRVFCPDCNSYNELEGPAGGHCRHCLHELLVVPAKTGADGTVTPVSVISRLTQASSNRVSWDNGSPHRGSKIRPWSPELFQDLPDYSSRPLNPPTDMDWPEVSAYMPVVCPSCQANPDADCEPCRRTGVRFVTLATWRGTKHQRVSSSAMRYLAAQYGARTNDYKDSIARFHGLSHMGLRGVGPLVMEKARSTLSADSPANPPRKP